MQRPLRLAPIPLLAAALLCACTVKGVDLGDLDTDQGSASDDATATEAASADASISATGAEGTGAELPDIGRPCDHGLDAEHVPDSRLLTTPAPACGGDICLYADLSEAPLGECTSYAQCNAEGGDRFVCELDSGTCRLGVEYFLTRSMCSAVCESDADCVADGDTNCMTGFSCTPMSSLGAACCQPVCVCNDDLDEASALQLAAECEDGSVPTGCCDEHPGQGLCPG